MAEKASVRTSTVTVTTTSQKVVEANTERKILGLQNKSVDNTILVKFGGDFTPAVIEAQRVMFDPAIVPTGGSFKLQYGETKTDAIGYDAVAGDVQTELRKVSGLENVIVDGSFVDGFTVEFHGEPADYDELEVTDNDLESSSTEVAEIQNIVFSASPTTGTYKVKYGANKTAAINYDDDAAAVQVALRLVTGLEAVTVAALSSPLVGFAVTFATSHEDVSMLEVTDSTLENELVQVDEVQEIYMNAEPTEGTFKLQFGDEGSGEETAALDFDASASDIQTALRALTNISNDTTVAGTCFQKVKQVMTYTVNILEDFPYSISSLLGEYIYTPPSGVPESKSVVASELVDLINANADEVFVASLGGTSPNQTVVLTAKTAGEAFVSDCSANITEATAVENNRGMTVTFTGTDGYQDRPLIRPYAADLKRYGEEVRIDVHSRTEGLEPADVTATVSEAVKGVDTASLDGSVETVREGVAYQNEGYALVPGARISTNEVSIIDEVWAVCDDDTALLEIMEG